MIKIGRLSKHLGFGEPLVIDGEEFIIKPLNIEHLPNFFKIMKAFSGTKKDATMEDVLKNINDEGLEAIKIVIEETLSLSMPDESEEDRKQFGLKYMGDLLGKIMELNSSDVTDDDKRKSEFLDKIKKTQNGLSPKPEI